MCFLCLGVGGCSAGAYCPNRLVGDNDVVELLPGDPGQTAGNLPLEHDEGLVGFALFQGFADAAQGA